MTENTRKEMNNQEINIMHLAVDILLHWRSIIIVMLVGGILLAGYSYYKSVKSAAAQQARIDQLQNNQTESTAQAELEQSLKAAFGEKVSLAEVDGQWMQSHLTQTQQYNVNIAVAYDKLYQEIVEYQNSSVIMQVDPNHVSSEEITFLVRSDDLERTYNIQKIYEDMLTSAGMYQYLEDNYGNGNTVNGIILLEGTTAERYDTVRIAVIHYDSEVCTLLAEGVIEYANKQCQGFQDSLGVHELILLDRSSAEGFVEEYYDLQQTLLSKAAQYMTNALSYKKKFSDKEWFYYNFQMSGELAGNPDAGKLDEDGKIIGGASAAALAVGTVTQPKISMKYTFLGMFLFAFVYVVILFVSYLLNNRLRGTDDLQELYHISQLGTIPQNAAEKKLFGFIDRLLLFLGDRGKRRFTQEEAIGLASVAVKLSVERDGHNSVCLIGCNLKQQTMAVCEQIKEKLEKENIQAHILNNVLYDAQAMRNLENVQNAVLVETAGSTFYDEVVREIELLERQEIKILGGIIVE